jgi:putative hemolysin
MIVTYINFGILFILLFLSGFFSGSETALFSLTEIQKKSLKDREPEKGNRISQLLENPGKLIITIILGNEFVNVSISTISAGLIITLFGQKVPWINIFIVLPTVLLLGEIVPKTFAINNNVKFASFIANPLTVFNKIITPFRWLIHHISDAIVNIFVREEARGGNILTEDVVKTIIEEGEKEGILDREEKYYINKIFDFGDTLLRDIMTPRSNLFVLPIDMKLGEMIKKIKENHYSAVPIYKDDIDNIQGILFATDLIGLRQEEINNSKETILRLLRKPVFISETTRADEMFKKFQQQKFSKAITIDEYGGVRGMITMEDLLEVIFGDIIDEFEVDDKKYRKIAENHYTLDGDLHLEDFNNIFDSSLDSKYVETIGGFLLNIFGELPDKNATTYYSDFHFKVVELEGNKISKIRVKKIK